jgi:hypothetical protein
MFGATAAPMVKLNSTATQALYANFRPTIYVT